MDNNSDVDSSVVRVLVLLTLPNMQGEWDELKGMVFPELRRFCEERGVEFIELDPPWEAAKSQMAQGEIYSSYMEMINQHRPYCIVPLGEDIGWTTVERQHFFHNNEFQWHDLLIRLITDGILNNPRMANCSFFYFRDPAYASRNGSNVPDVNLAQSMLLTDMKARIRTSGLPIYENYPDPKIAAQRIEEDLRRVIEAHYLKSVLETASDRSSHGDFEGAVEILQQALKITPGQRDLINNIVEITHARVERIFERLQRDVDVQEANKLVNSAVGILRSAIQLTGSEQLAMKEQLKELEGIRHKMDSEAQYLLAIEVAKKALQDYKPGINYQPTLSKLDTAQRDLEKTAQLFSTERQISNNLDEIITAKKNLASMEAAYLNSVGVNLVNDAGKAINNIAMIAETIDKLRKGERYLAQAHELDPRNDIILSNLAQVRQILSKLGQVSSEQTEKPKVVNLEMPASRVDQVHFTITAPMEVMPGEPIVVDLWAHLQKQRSEVIRRAKQALGSEEVLVQSVGPVQVTRGTVLRARLQIDGCQIDDPENTIQWQGQIGNATFAVIIPKQVPTGALLGKIYIYADTVQVARIDFRLRVGKQLRKVDTLPVQVSHHKKAFASYASADREAVLARIQGMQKAAPNLEIFLDVLSLRSGQKWEQELWKIIPRCDILYLFWSENASRSAWVEKEWRCALDKRGLDFIDPVPLVSPDLVPPPPELAGKHFNDWVLAFQRRS